jgi:hypothetical protein
MIWPVRDWEKWYSAQKFGAKTSYGYHEGEDINLKSGGDTDLGQPLLAITDGEVTSVHAHTTKPTFGNHIHIRHDGPWGRVWCHYAHCKDISVEVGERVKESQLIATIGKTGTTFAHLHWAIKRQPTGIDGLAKTKEALDKWLPPIDFVLEWSRKLPNNMDWLTEYFRSNFQIDLTKEEGIVRGELQRLVDALSRYENAEANVKKLEKEMEGLAGELGESEQRLQAIERNRARLEKEITEKNKIIAGRETALSQLEKDLAEFEGKVVLTEEEYQRLSNRECLKRFTRWQLLREFLRIRRG